MTQNDSSIINCWEDGVFCIVAGLQLTLSHDLESIDFLLPFIDKKKRNRIQKFRFSEDACRVLFADLLVRKLITDHIDLANNMIRFSINSFGKPELAGQQNIHFSISHSGCWIVCALSDFPIGVDIEEINPRNMDVADRFFSAEENKFLSAKSESEQLSYFYKIWTLKESYIKMIGKGLREPLKNFTVQFQEDSIRLIQNKESDASIIFKTYDIDSNYQTAGCSFSSPLPERIIPIQECDLIHHFQSGQKHAV